ncbi:MULTISPECIES: hypothetical protein [Flavobacteriaceae]|uniref:hypothetical protein n=1 Tax=Flavobacteriaceae TaxID=49546 RepID=UPI00103CA360|nr:hypothetical protein [Meridianimaribacter sp. CL38]TBV25580.1 hypothetical protein DMZ43_11590 [Meridianimaribacter sp. CL38]
MKKELNDLIESIDNLKNSNDEFINLTNSLLSSDFHIEHKLVSITSVLNSIIKNQSFILELLKMNIEKSSENRLAILNIIEKIEKNN